MSSLWAVEGGRGNMGGWGGGGRVVISDRWQQQWHSKHVHDDTWCHLLDVSSRQVDSPQVLSIPTLHLCIQGICHLAVQAVSKHTLASTLCAVGGGVRGIADLPWPCLLGLLLCSLC